MDEVKRKSDSFAVVIEHPLSDEGREVHDYSMHVHHGEWCHRVLDPIHVARKLFKSFIETGNQPQFEGQDRKLIIKSEIHRVLRFGP